MCVEGFQKLLWANRSLGDESVQPGGYFHVLFLRRCQEPLVNRQAELSYLLSGFL